MAIRFSNRRGIFSSIKKEFLFMSKLFKGKKGRLCALLILIIIGIIASSITPYLFGLLIDSIIAADVISLKRYIALFLGFNVLSIMIELIESVIGNDISVRVSCEIKQELLEKILFLKAKEQDKYSAGEWMNRLEGDADSIVSYYIDLLSSVIMIVINIMISVIFLINISPLLTVVAILLLPFSYLINYVFRNKIRFLKKIQKEVEDENYSLINCILNNFKNIKVWQIEGYFINKYSLIKEKQIKAQKSSLHLSLGISLLQKVNNQIFEIIILIVSALLIFSGNLSIGGMVSFNTYLEKLFSAISKFMGLNLDKQNIKISMERIEEIDKKEKECIGHDGDEIYIDKLAFNQVSFGYFSTNVLSDISFSINKPGIYSFVGRNGAGKTSLLKLLSKLYEVGDGSITINGKNIDSISTSTLRNSITFMMKEPLIIAGSLWDNLIVGAKDEINEVDIANICQKVRLTSLIEKIGGYQGIINADSLSSGEKQKIGLVRVLLRKSRLIMLDEVTSDLDGNIENIIIALLEELANNAIIINVCHRKKLVESSTNIFVIEENKGIVESGTHQELKQKKGIYNELF